LSENTRKETQIRLHQSGAASFGGNNKQICSHFLSGEGGLRLQLSPPAHILPHYTHASGLGIAFFFENELNLELTHAA